MRLLTPSDVAGAVDLDKIPCTGCRHKAGDGACRRHPPMWRAPMPVQTPDGQIGLDGGAWTFPPAVLRCGEFAQRAE